MLPNFDISKEWGYFHQKSCKKSAHVVSAIRHVCRLCMYTVVCMYTAFVFVFVFVKVYIILKVGKDITVAS